MVRIDPVSRGRQHRIEKQDDQEQRKQQTSAEPAFHDGALSICD
jgi:hypothetical protein